MKIENLADYVRYHVLRQLRSHWKDAWEEKATSWTQEYKNKIAKQYWDLETFVCSYMTEDQAREALKQYDPDRFFQTLEWEWESLVEFINHVGLYKTSEGRQLLREVYKFILTNPDFWPDGIIPSDKEKTDAAD